MQYKAKYRLRWILVLWLIFLIYVSPFVFVKLPFIEMKLSLEPLSEGVIKFLLSFIPKFNVEFHIYNLQTITIWACGIILGPILGLVTTGIYLLLGLFGLPMFAGGGGFDYFKEPTFGYLISFPLIAYLSGYFNLQGKKILMVLVPIVSSHLIGIIYLLICNPSFIGVAWHLSFSMIGYDLILGFLLTPMISITSFILNEIFIQEVPAFKA